MQPLHRAPRSNSLLVAHFPLHASAADGCRSSGGLLPQAQHTRQHRQQHDAAGRPSVAVFKRRARGQRQQSIRALRVCQLQCAAMVISHVTKRFRWRYDACFQFVVRRKEGMKRNPSFVEQLKQCVLQPPPPPPLVHPRLKCSRRYEKLLLRAASPPPQHAIMCTPPPLPSPPRSFIAPLSVPHVRVPRAKVQGCVG